MKKIVNNFVLLAAALLLGACEMLPLQKNEKYEGKALDPQMGMTCLEYIESQDMLKNMRDAIGICGLEDYYSQTDQKLTYLLSDNSILSQTEVLDAADNLSKRQALTNRLLFHIIRGEYHTYGALNYDPVSVLTMYDNQQYLLTVRVNANASDRNAEGRIVVERINLDLPIPNTNPTNPLSRNISSSNYFFTNGVGHYLASALTL